MKVLFVASEALPFMASGGLGDVAGSLPAALRKRRVTTALRAYAAFATSAARGAVRVVPE